MAIKTTVEQLESVQTAIAAIESGSQSYMMGDVKVTNADLDVLYKRENVLLSRYNRSKRNGGRIRLNMNGGV